MRAMQWGDADKGYLDEGMGHREETRWPTSRTAARWARGEGDWEKGTLREEREHRQQEHRQRRRERNALRVQVPWVQAALPRPT